MTSEFPEFCYSLKYPGQRTLEASNPELSAGTEKKSFKKSLLPLAKSPRKGWPHSRKPFWQDLPYSWQTRMEKSPHPTLTILAGLSRELIFYFSYPPCMEASNSFLIFHSLFSRSSGAPLSLSRWCLSPTGQGAEPYMLSFYPTLLPSFLVLAHWELSL